jgi:hypothetical protein
MPHARPRLAVKSLKKKLRYFRVVSLQGARQTGKSFLARELREQAENTPDSFLDSHSEFTPLACNNLRERYSRV